MTKYFFRSYVACYQLEIAASDCEELNGYEKSSGLINIMNIHNDNTKVFPSNHC